jgi:hypothetical protein
MNEQSAATLKRTSDASVQLIRDSLDALNRGDAQAMSDTLTDDVEWHEIGRAEPIVGKEALGARYMAPDGPAYEIHGELHDVLANDEHAIALVTATASMGGRTFTYRTAEIFHIRDGKISARWAFSDDTGAINRFFGGA